jgi:hypothetical protein
MLRSSQQPNTTEISTEYTLEEDALISEAANMAGLTRDQLAQQALKRLLIDIRNQDSNKKVAL